MSSWFGEIFQKGKNETHCTLPGQPAWEHNAVHMVGDSGSYMQSCWKASSRVGCFRYPLSTLIPLRVTALLLWMHCPTFQQDSSCGGVQCWSFAGWVLMWFRFACRRTHKAFVLQPASEALAPWIQCLSLPSFKKKVRRKKLWVSGTNITPAWMCSAVTCQRNLILTASFPMQEAAVSLL